MKNFYLTLCLIFCCNFASGAESNIVDQRLDSFAKKLQTFQKSLANLENHAENNEYKNLMQEIKMLHGEIERLDSRVTENSIAVKDLMDKNNSSKKDKSINSKDEYIINNIAREIVKDQNQDVRQEFDKSNDRLIASQYQAAYILFRQKNDKGQPNYDGAQEAFNSFVQKYPNHPLTGNAFYWLGQMQFDLGKYNKAAIFYLKGHKINSSSGRALDNLLGLSKSLTKLGKNEEACASLNQIFNDFSTITSDIKQEVDELYKSNNCTNE